MVWNFDSAVIFQIICIGQMETNGLKQWVQDTEQWVT